MKTIIIFAALLCAAPAFSQGQFQKEAAGMIGYKSDQVVKLAQTIPEDKYAWRPADGARSVAETFAHLASANYYFASTLGAKIPDGVNMETLEKELKTKDAIISELKRSYQVATDAIKNTTDASLTKKVEFPFPGEFTQMTAILIIVTHSNEHLGQLIAYARMNDITPPWSE
jgi:uncharacterized damage-inducible protein DinB